MKQPDPRRARAEMHGLADDEYFWEMMVPAWDDASAGTPGQRLLAVTTSLVRDVENGGMQQALWNRSGGQAEEAIAALERLGAAEQAAAARAAVRLLLGDAPPAALHARRAVLDAHPRAWVNEQVEPLDERLYDETRLWPCYRRYIDAHPAEFFRD